MRILRNCAYALAISAFGLLPTADSSVIAEDGQPGEITGSVSPSSRLRLSDEQRFNIYEGVMQMPEARVADVPVPDPAVALPSSVPLQPLPDSVVREIPRAKNHQFVKLDDRILVVDPGRRIVAEIPRYKIVLQ